MFHYLFSIKSIFVIFSISFKDQVRLHGIFELYLHHLEEGRLEYRYVVFITKKNANYRIPEQIGRSDRNRRYLDRVALEQHCDEGLISFCNFYLRLQIT